MAKPPAADGSRMSPFNVITATLRGTQFLQAFSGVCYRITTPRMWCRQTARRLRHNAGSPAV